MFASGGLVTFAAIDYVYTLGRAAGIVATVLLLTQLLLASRAPWIERALGHDRAIAAHTRLGKWAIILMLSHAGIITAMTAYYDGRSLPEQQLEFFNQAWFLAAAQIAAGVFVVILATSLMIVRGRWRYETWHLVHLLVYVGTAAAVPHQFLWGTTFSSGGAAWWFWLLLYVVAVGSLVVYRVVRPLWVFGRHQITVKEVATAPDGTTTVTMGGRNLGDLAPLPGQFFLWRFLDRDRWREAHPFSLSSSPSGDTLRISVKSAGDFSRSLRHLTPGTRVMVEGPLGVFSGVTRTRDGLVMVAAGIGVTPVRAMLEAHDPSEGPCTVILRVRSEQDAPLLDEVTALAAQRDAQLHVLTGPRGGSGWAPGESHDTLVDLVPDLHNSDVYICGPLPWADAVQGEAVAAGVPVDAVHRERFGW
jgi:predicted ferric reductase